MGPYAVPLSSMPSPIAERRCEIARAFASTQVSPPRLDHARLRFTLGTSLADLKVPFHIAPDAARIFLQSGRQLALMLLSRHRDFVASDELDPFLLNEEFSALPDAPRFLSPASGGPDIRQVSTLAYRMHPALTGGVMATWLGPGGGGRSLVALIIELFRKAFSEMAQSRGREETPTLVALMVASLLPQVEAGIRATGLPPPSDRPLRCAAGVGVYLALRLALERVLKEARAPSDVAMRVEAALSPMVLLGGRAGLQVGSSTLYGADLAPGLPRSDEVLARLSGGATIESLLGDVVSGLNADEDQAKRAEAAIALGGVREAFVQLTLVGEQSQLPQDLTEYARHHATRVDRLAALLFDEKARKELSKELGRAINLHSDQARHAVNVLATMLKSYKDKEPAACVGLSRPQARQAYAYAALGATCDLWLERALLPLHRLVEPRTGAESEGGVEGEYAAGRLYRVSIGNTPILRVTDTVPMGHLFVDVKDFTRRTALLGQAVIADFLRREFYLPILTAAKSHFGGMSHLADRGGVTINNLLGDALSMSGSIEALMRLTLDIRRQLSSYERKLARAVSAEQIAKTVKEIEAEYDRKMSAPPPGASPEAIAAEKEAAVARARGEGLEAGVFVSFGPAPLVVTIDDDVFGRSKVAIADRINESARGTARSGGARARADALLGIERARRKDFRLNHAWNVFVGAPLTVNVPVVVEDGARRAAKSGDMRGAMQLLSESVQDAIYEALKNEDRGGDIYNAGAALSEEALRAYQAAMSEQRIFKELDVDPATLHAELRKRYFFPPAPFRLLLGYEINSRQLVDVFRLAGRVMFKGFERTGGIPVWEIVSESPVAALFAQHHATDWLRK